MGSRHLRRLFLKHLGATPIAVAQTRRVHFAKKLIDESGLSMTDVALASGFNSVRRFNATFQNLYGRTPSELRRLSRGVRDPGEPGRYRFRLDYRPPLDWASLLDFLGSRAIPGVESVEAGEYRRNIALQGESGSIAVRSVRGKPWLELDIQFPDPRALLRIVERVRRIFDLQADPAQVERQFTHDTMLAPLLRSYPGLRVPGCWDGFELAVRAILGQQVSVKGASTLAGRIAKEFGTPVPGGYLFPEPQTLADADLSAIRLTQKRARAIAGAGNAHSDRARNGCTGRISLRDRFGGAHDRHPRCWPLDRGSMWPCVWESRMHFPPRIYICVSTFQRRRNGARGVPTRRCTYGSRAAANADRQSCFRV